MILIKNKKSLLIISILILIYFALSFVVSFSAFNIATNIKDNSPKDVGLNFEEIEIKTENSSISTWWIPNNSETTILLLHGLRGQKADELIIEKIKLFNDLGFSIIAIDFRNHGKSGLGTFTFGLDEVNDVYSTMNYYKSNHGINEIGIWGFSYGATTAIFTGLEFNERNIDIEITGIFAESPYFDLLEVFTDQVALRTPLTTSMAQLLKPGTVLLTKLIYGFDFSSVEKKYLSTKKLEIPTVLIACLIDEIIPPRQVSEIEENIGLKSKTIIFDDCDSHGSALKSDRDKYIKALLEVFN